MFGDDNGALTWVTSGANANRMILGRRWRVQETNNETSYMISVPDDSSSAASKLPGESSTVYLLVDADGDFASGAIEVPMNLSGTERTTSI